MSPLNANTVTLDDVSVAAPCHGHAMVARRPRVALNITPRLLQDTLSVALSQHADVVDLMEWRQRSQTTGDPVPVFDLAVVSGGVLPEAVAASVVIDIDGTEGVPTLDSLHERLRAMSGDERS